jgi:hypothetical protein
MENPGSGFGQSPSFQPPMQGGAPSQGLAIGALVCGVLSCLCCFSIATGPAGLIMGFIAKKKAEEDPMHYTGRGLALGGMITGIIGILGFIALIVLQIFFGVLSAISR